MSKFKMPERKPCILVNGLRRSGNHIFLKWFCESMREVTHYNNVSTRVKDLDSRKSEVLIYGSGMNTLISTEDRTLLDAGAIAAHWKYQPKLRIVILRSHPNVYASRAKMLESVSENAWEHGTMRLDRVNELWVDNATPTPGWDVVLFDNFIEDPKYREHLRAKWRFPHIDFDFDFVPKQGKGSSFDRRSVPGSKMNVNERHLTMDDIPTTPKVDALMKRRFGWSL